MPCFAQHLRWRGAILLPLTNVSSNSLLPVPMVVWLLQRFWPLFSKQIDFSLWGKQCSFLHFCTLFSNFSLLCSSGHQCRRMGNALRTNLVLHLVELETQNEPWRIVRQGRIIFIHFHLALTHSLLLISYGWWQGIRNHRYIPIRFRIYHPLSPKTPFLCQRATLQK